MKVRAKGGACRQRNGRGGIGRVGKGGRRVGKWRVLFTRPVARRRCFNIHECIPAAVQSICCLLASRPFTRASAVRWGGMGRGGVGTE